MVNQVFARGAFLGLIALYFLVQAPGYGIGSFNRPGPGLFSALVGSLLLLIAGIIIVRSRLAEAPPLDLKLRNIGLVTASLLAFVAVTEYVNMIVAIATMVTIVSFATENFSWRRTAIIAASLCAVAIVMKMALGVQLPLNSPIPLFGSLLH